MNLYVCAEKSVFWSTVVILVLAACVPPPPTPDDTYEDIDNPGLPIDDSVDDPGTLPPPVDDFPGDDWVPPATVASARLRVATFNTQCIVPEMDSELWDHIDTILEGKLPCIATIVEFIGDVANFLSLGLSDYLDPLDFRDVIEDRTTERADSIVQSILSNPKYDIIAFNEVFLEDARDILVDGLQSTFPYYIEKLSGETPCTEDSGLMIFSRWPFQQVPLQFGPSGGQVVWVDSAFSEFGSCDCEDCLADKGATYVRIQNPNTSDLYHIVFTHLQADAVCPATASVGVNQFANTRTGQLATLKKLLDQQLAPQGYTDDVNVIVMGDLNVVGTQPKALDAVGLSVDNDEWFDKFDPVQAAGGYFAGDPFNPVASSPLFDTWAQTTSPHDPGITQGKANRLDYILLNAYPFGPSRRLMPHHLTLLFDHTISDHLGVHAVINRWQPHCTPAEAVAPQAGYYLPGMNPSVAPDQVLLGPWPNNQAYPKNITVPGGYQWFRFDLPGTYSFSVDSAAGQNAASGFELRVYKDTDLTYDILNYYGEETDITEYFELPPGFVDVPQPETIIGKKYLIPDAPFYVRIAPTAENGQGSYTLYAHRHEGRSKKDAVALPACCTQDYFHGTTALNSDDMPWFQLNLEVAESGLPQSLRFIAMWDPLKGNGPLTLRLQDETDTILAQSSTAATSSASVNDNDPAYGENQPRHYVELFHENLEPLGTRFYLRVGRPGFNIPGSGLSSNYDMYAMRWETNLTILHGRISAETHPLELYCSDETCADYTGSDEIGMSVWHDGTFWYHVTPNQIGGEATDMDSKDTVSLENVIGPIRFVNSAMVKVVEYDGGTPEDYGDIPLEGLLPRLNKAWNLSKGKGVNCSGFGSDGTYYFYYNLSRSLYYNCD